jgi:hypothetical protein
MRHPARGRVHVGAILGENIAGLSSHPARSDVFVCLRSPLKSRRQRKRASYAGWLAESVQAVLPFKLQAPAKTEKAPHRCGAFRIAACGSDYFSVFSFFIPLSIDLLSLLIDEPVVPVCLLSTAWPLVAVPG